MMKLESVGIYDNPCNKQDDERVIKQFYDTVEIHDHKIFVQFPWKSNTNQLADNYGIALGRLHQLYVGLRNKSEDQWVQYCNIIDDHIRREIVEEVQPLQKGHWSRYYMSHQAVFKPSSHTTKCRIVFDASSKRNGEFSLNDVIHQGPLLLPNLCGILLRCRVGAKLLTADVEKAFHMIYLQESERDAVRFLWLKDRRTTLTEQYANPPI
ncbi:unnamed protein product [Heligmosomoides polygyrus]|uniref:Reverse transcriptase domain-containing protein n=1 Tax=Heligmosomoides polygyrus TaxID=6339 RepID=A0A183G1R4_HELPZ|nr:unnamed protein product [Heligmosomoides polygyrus]